MERDENASTHQDVICPATVNAAKWLAPSNNLRSNLIQNWMGNIQTTTSRMGVSWTIWQDITMKDNNANKQNIYWRKKKQ